MAEPGRKTSSPCVDLCVIHPASGLCMGCYRSTDEIAGWMGYSEKQRQEIMMELPARASQVGGQRRGGRKSRR